MYTVENNDDSMYLCNGEIIPFKEFPDYYSLDPDTTRLLVDNPMEGTGPESVVLGFPLVCYDPIEETLYYCAVTGSDTTCYLQVWKQELGAKTWTKVISNYNLYNINTCEAYLHFGYVYNGVMLLLVGDHPDTVEKTWLYSYRYAAISIKGTSVKQRLSLTSTYNNKKTNISLSSTSRIIDDDTFEAFFYGYYTGSSGRYGRCVVLQVSSEGVISKTQDVTNTGYLTNRAQWCPSISAYVAWNSHYDDTTSQHFVVALNPVTGSQNNASPSGESAYYSDALIPVDGNMVLYSSGPVSLRITPSLNISVIQATGLSQSHLIYNYCKWNNGYIICRGDGCYFSNNLAAAPAEETKIVSDVIPYDHNYHEIYSHPILRFIYIYNARQSGNVELNLYNSISHKLPIDDDSIRYIKLK